MLHTSFYASKTVRENSKEKLKLGYRVIKMFECYYFFFLNVELNSFPFAFNIYITAYYYYN